MYRLISALAGGRACEHGRQHEPWAVAQPLPHNPSYAWGCLACLLGLWSSLPTPADKRTVMASDGRCAIRSTSFSAPTLITSLDAGCYGRDGLTSGCSPRRPAHGTERTTPVFGLYMSGRVRLDASGAGVVRVAARARRTHRRGELPQPCLRVGRRYVPRGSCGVDLQGTAWS